MSPVSVAETAASLAPEPAIVTGSREQLLHLLAEAAEIEHTLMCSYLYAAFSLKRRGEGALSDAQGDAVERWRKTIMDVAVEEMGHLLIVANLMLAVGGRPHFARPNFPVAPGYFPAAVVVRLSGFSRETLDHFVFLERPQGVAGADARAYDREHYRRDQAVEGLMPVTQDYATIGHLYDAIRANVRSLADSLGEDALFLCGTAGQIDAADLEMERVSAIDGVAAAMAAIDVIVEQGEGSPADREDSHCQRFVAIRDELARLHAADPQFAPRGRSSPIRCCAHHRIRTTPASSTSRRAHGCSISPAPHTGCCCARWCRASAAPAPMRTPNVRHCSARRSSSCTRSERRRRHWRGSRRVLRGPARTPA
ncbi:MAG TPA: ferritin-like protein [Dokdonella sp.]